MPVMDGETFARTLSQDESRRDLMIAVVSTESNEERLQRMRNLGVKGILHKPFDPKDLCEMTGDLLQGTS